MLKRIFKFKHVALFVAVVLNCQILFDAQALQDVATTTLPPAFVLSIRDAVELTIKNNSEIKISQAILDRESAKRSGIWGSLLPEVNFIYSWNRSKASIESGGGPFEGTDYNSYRAAFVFSQPIFRGGKLWSAPIAQSALTERARLDVKIAEREQLTRMARSYFALLLYQEQVQTLKRQFDTQSKLIRQARQRYRMGAERELTVLQFETQSALLRPQIIEAENNLQSEAVRLLNLIGKSDVSSIRVIGSLESVREYQPITAAQTNIEELPELQSAYQNSRYVDAARAVVMADHWPSLEATGNYGHQSYTRSEMFSPNTTSWNYGLTLTIPVFSGLSSFSKRRELAAQMAEARYREKSVRDSVAIALVQREKALRTSRELIEAKKIAFDLARRSYQKASEMFRFGTLTYRDFFDIERDLIGAELSYHSSLNQHLAAVIDFHVVTGQDIKPLLESFGAAPVVQ